MRGERIAAPLFALLIVFSGAGGAIAPGASPVGVSSAQAADTEECSTWDAWVYDFFNTGHSGNEDNPCSAAYQVQQVTDEWNETDADQTRTQIHSQAGQLSAGNEQFFTVQSNALTESNTIAFSKGEAAAVEVLANGGTVSEAQQAANESIEDYYAVKQINTLDRWNVNVQTVKTLNQRATNTTNVDSDFVTFGSTDNFTHQQVHSPGTDVFKSTIAGTDTTTNTTVNGSSHQVQRLVFGPETDYEYTSNGGTYTQKLSEHAGGGLDPQVGIQDHSFGSLSAEGGHGDMYEVSAVRVRPTANLSSKTAMNFEEFKTIFNQISQKSQETKQEVAVYINDSLGPAVENGNLDAQSYVSPSTLAQEYAQSYNGSESYIRATAIAAYSGMDTPSLENVGSMTVSHDGKTYEGLLLSQVGPSGGWQSGETYDAALLSGLQLFAVAGENSTVVELDGAFTVESITGTGGEQISEATTVNVTYETSNASANYTALQEQIRELNRQIEERQAQATIPESDVETNDGLLAKIATALGVGTGVVLLVAAGAVVLIARVYLPDS